jgi:asparagine synthase (glutamine-hydrolysing)
MCGLAGYLNVSSRPANGTVVKRMTDAIAHRGPDGEAVWSNGPIAIGHRRLAIIDLTDGGRQPMETEDGRYVLVYNGEIYNYAELRTSLQAVGDTFHSSSDTEVLLKGLARYGQDFLPRLNGMFAFALWDTVERVLLLARDRWGVKPLYYARAGDALVFGSEIKALQCHPDFVSTLNLQALRQYLTFQNYYDDQTLFKGVHLLPAGTAMRIELAASSEPQISLNRYWSFDFIEGNETRPEVDVAADVRSLFEQAVNRQMVADVEVGAYLSGGMDSGSVTAVAASYTPYLRTFTCGFDLSSASGLELYFDERVDAELMSAVFKTEHYEMVLKSGDMERAMPQLVHHLEEPRVGQCYPNFLIARLAGKFNKVVLAGTGGDELFAGYPWRYEQSYGTSQSELVDNIFKFWQRIFPDAAAEKLFAPVWSDVKDMDMRSILAAKVPELSQKPEQGEILNAIQSFEAQTFLHGILSVEDKISMAHSLEVRVPFLDNDLVDFARALPSSYKLARFNPAEGAAPKGGRKAEGKHILRNALSSLIPEQIAKRDKQGFSAPDASWFKGQSLDFVRGRIAHPRARIYNVLSYDVVSPLLERHFSGETNSRLAIWSLLYLEELFEQHKLA